MTSASARRAWNDAMKVTAGAAALPPALQLGDHTKRRSDRNKKQDRRIKARKGTVYSSNAYGGEDQLDHKYRIALWVDMLEGIDPTTSVGVTADDDEEYDELEEFEEDATKKRKKRTTTTTKKDTKKIKSKVACIPKRYLPKSLGVILMEEASRNDDNQPNAARCFIESEARIERQDGQSVLPRRKFCPVTGTLALYTEPKSGIPYTTFRALEQIRERAPVWMMAAQNNNGVASYYEAVKSIEES